MTAPPAAARPRTSVDVRTEPIGGSSLARLALAGNAPRDWYEPRPRDADGWRARIEQVRGDVHAGWLTQVAPALGARGAAATRLARSADGRGVVVTTGQQPGLFGGPLYTWFKALSALALADALEAATGVPVAPVFWAATDDADFAEAAETWVADDAGGHRVVMAPRDTAGRPMAEVPLGALDDQFDVLARACGSGAHADVLALARASYAPGATVGSAYVALLRALLEPLGVAVLDASHPAVRAAGAPLLRAALRQADVVDAAARARAEEIARAGHAPQVPPVDDLTLVQAQDASGAKARVPFTRARYAADDQAAVLSATVLLRPVMERAILPTVAYVAGPGELAYFAQASAVADALGAARPLVLPRWSATLVEPRVQRLMDRLDLEPAALDDPHAPERALAATLMPRAVVDAIATLRADVARAVEALGAAGVAPSAVADGFLREQTVRIDRLERRYRAAVRRREVARFADLAAVRGALRPDGLRQERALNLLPFLARYGVALLEDLRDAARLHAAALVDGGSAAAGAAAPAAAARA